MMDNKVGSILLTEFKNGENVLAKVSPRSLIPFIVSKLTHTQYNFVPKTKLDIFNHHEVTLQYAYRYLSKKVRGFISIL